MRFGIRSIRIITSICLGCFLSGSPAASVKAAEAGYEAISDSDSINLDGEQTSNIEESPLFLKKTSVNLFIGGSKGTKRNGKKAPAAKYMNVRKYVEGFDAEKYDIRLESSDKTIATVSNKKDRIYPKKIGQTEVLVSVKDKKSREIVYRAVINVNVKKNAEAADLILDGISDKEYFDSNESVPVTFYTENDTDLRSLTCEDESVIIKPLKLRNSFMVSFTEPGVFEITAATYQSESYKGHIFEKTFKVTVDKAESDVYQISTDSFKIKGGCVFYGMLPEDIEVYTLVNGTKAFFSSIEQLTVKDDVAEVRMFREFTPETEYFVECDGERISFVASKTGRDSVASFSIENTTVQSGKMVPVKVHYYNEAGVDISNDVSKELDAYLNFSITTEDSEKGFFSNGNIYMMSPDLEIKAHAVLNIPNEYGSIVDGKKLEADYTFVSVAVEEAKYTKKYIYSYEADDDVYLKISDSCEHVLALNDKVYIEALFEFSDGVYRSFSEAGVTEVVSSDPSIVMVGAGGADGSYGLITNEVGTAHLLLYSGDKVLEVIPVTVNETRKPATLHTELSKTKLNTDIYAGDYLILKADVFDQYGRNIEANDITIEQPEDNMKAVGQVMFGSFISGRLVINGWDVITNGNTGNIRATVKSCGLSENISFSVKEVPYDYSKIKEYEYHLKLDGDRYLDTCIFRGNVIPESTFISVVAESDGYFVYEGLGEVFKEKPTMIKTAADYNISEGDILYGILIERTDYITGKTETVGDDPCIIPSYSDLEFAPFIRNAKLAEGEYTVTLYLVTGGNPVSQLEVRDKAVINIFDSELEIEARQLEEEAIVPMDAPWEKNIKSFFSFTLDGVDITDCITKVDCNISANREVYFKTVTFMIPNAVYGDYERVLNLEKLVFVK